MVNSVTWYKRVGMRSSVGKALDLRKCKQRKHLGKRSGVLRPNV